MAPGLATKGNPVTDNEKRVAENISISVALIALLHHSPEARARLGNCIEDIAEDLLCRTLTDDQIALVKRGLLVLLARSKD